MYRDVAWFVARSTVAGEAPQVHSNGAYAKADRFRFVLKFLARCFFKTSSSDGAQVFLHRAGISSLERFFSRLPTLSLTRTHRWLRL